MRGKRFTLRHAFSLVNPARSWIEYRQTRRYHTGVCTFFKCDHLENGDITQSKEHINRSHRSPQDLPNGTLFIAELIVIINRVTKAFALCAIPPVFTIHTYTAVDPS